MSSIDCTGGDRSLCETPPGKSGSPHPRMVLVTTILASSLAFVDGSVVNVGLPAIGHSFPGAGAALPWVVNGYLLPLSALLLLSGAAGDRFGRDRLLMIGIVIFALASIGCALAPSFSVLVAARIVQGTGAAMLMPNSLAVLGNTFKGAARGRAIGTWAAVGAMTSAGGPVLGGWLIELSGWPMIFLINLPLAAAALFMAWRYVGDHRDTKALPLDVAGAALATAALGCIAAGLTFGSAKSGWGALAMGLLVAGIALLVALVWLQWRRGEHAMMPLSMFGSASFIGLTLLTFLLYAALGGLLVLLPYVLIVGAGYSTTEAGAALLPLPIVLAALSPLMGGLAGRIGSRLPLTVGPLIVAAGFLLMLRIGPHGSYWTTVLPAILVAAFGLSGAVAPLTTAVLAAVDNDHRGSASGFNSAIARTGGLIATALLGSVLVARGAELFGGFHTAVVVGAVSAAAAGLCGLVLLGKQRRGS